MKKKKENWRRPTRVTKVWKAGIAAKKGGWKREEEEEELEEFNEAKEEAETEWGPRTVIYKPQPTADEEKTPPRTVIEVQEQQAGQEEEIIKEVLRSPE